jgi:hypothetical protein
MQSHKTRMLFSICMGMTLCSLCFVLGVAWAMAGQWGWQPLVTGAGVAWMMGMLAQNYENLALRFAAVGVASSFSAGLATGTLDSLGTPPPTFFPDFVHYESNAMVVVVIVLICVGILALSFMAHLARS